MQKVCAVSALLALSASFLLGQGDFEKGISYYKQGQFEKAAQEFEKIVAEDPNYESGFRVLGDSYLKLKKYDLASRAFGKAIALNSNNFSSFYGAAVAEFNQDRYPECVTNLLRGERQAKTPKERYQLYRLRGAAYYNQKKFREAASDLEKAVEIQRGDYNDALQLGVSFFQIGNLSGARQYLEQASGLNPSAAEPRQFLSRLAYQEAVRLIEAGQYSQAAAALTEYVRAHPDEGDAWYNLGLSLTLAKDWDGAERALNQATGKLPDRWEGFSRLGYVLEMKQRYPEALKAYQRAFALRPEATLKEDVDRIQERIRRARESNS